MATRNRGTEKKQDKEVVKVESFKVTRAYEFTNKNVAFDMILNGINFYGLTVVKGKNGDFISFPQRKVGEKYYSIYYIPLDELDADAIMDEVYKVLG